MTTMVQLHLWGPGVRDIHICTKEVFDFIQQRKEMTTGSVVASQYSYLEFQRRDKHTLPDSGSNS
jgi:hypothetical protein